MKTEKKGDLELFFEKNEWCQGGYAQDSKGFFVDESSPEAVSFCLLGGMIKAVKLKPGGVGMGAVAIALRRCIVHRKSDPSTLYADIASWNDCKGRTKEDVLAMCHKAGV